METVKCSKCGLETEIYARNRCRSCYRKEHKSTRKIICANCKKESLHHALGFCQPCYQNLRKKAMFSFESNHNKEMMYFMAGLRIRNVGFTAKPCLCAKCRKDIKHGEPILTTMANQVLCLNCGKWIIDAFERNGFRDESYDVAKDIIGRIFPN